MPLTDEQKALQEKAKEFLKKKGGACHSGSYISCKPQTKCYLETFSTLSPPWLGLITRFFLVSNDKRKLI